MFRFALVLLSFSLLLGGCTSGRVITPSDNIQPIEASSAAKSTAEEDLINQIALRPGAISAATNNAKDYRIGPDDILTITVFQVDDLSGEYIIDGAGQLRMPLIGGVQVAGMTAPEIELTLETLYGADYLQNPEVTVYVSEYQSQQITVMGEVNFPGMFPLKGQTTLMEALALARGVNRIADMDTIIVFREEAGQIMGYVVNLKEVMSGAKPDPDIFGNDRIVVPEDGSASFLRSLSVGLPGFGGFRQY
jgi:polysaccharide export outer membrane protein